MPIDTEDWNAYRKLIIDTLKRLDDRTSELFDTISDLQAKVLILEHSNTPENIKNLQKEISDINSTINSIKTVELASLKNDISVIKTKETTDSATTKLSWKILLTVGSAVWAITLLVIGAVIKHFTGA